jgi:hypothetical protein
MAWCHSASISEIGSSSQPLHDRGRELRAPACASSLVTPYRAAVTVGVGGAQPKLNRDPHRTQPHRWRELLDDAGHQMPGHAS